MIDDNFELQTLNDIIGRVIVGKRYQHSAPEYEIAADKQNPSLAIPPYNHKSPVMASAAAQKVSRSVPVGLIV